MVCSSEVSLPTFIVSTFDMTTVGGVILFSSDGFRLLFVPYSLWSVNDVSFSHSSLNDVNLSRSSLRICNDIK